MPIYGEYPHIATATAMMHPHIGLYRKPFGPAPCYLNSVKILLNFWTIDTAYSGIQTRDLSDVLLLELAY